MGNTNNTNDNYEIKSISSKTATMDELNKLLSFSSTTESSISDEDKIWTINMSLFVTKPSELKDKMNKLEKLEYELSQMFDLSENYYVIFDQNNNFKSIKIEFHITIPTKICSKDFIKEQTVNLRYIFMKIFVDDKSLFVESDGIPLIDNSFYNQYSPKTDESTDIIFNDKNNTLHHDVNHNKNAKRKSKKKRKAEGTETDQISKKKKRKRKQKQRKLIEGNLDITKELEITEICKEMDCINDNILETIQIVKNMNKYDNKPSTSTPSTPKSHRNNKKNESKNLFANSVNAKKHRFLDQHRNSIQLTVGNEAQIHLLSSVTETILSEDEIASCFD